MKLLRHIVKKPSTKLVKAVPTCCASCKSGRFFREPRTNQDLMFDIQRRYLCRSCWSVTLLAGCAEEHLLETQHDKQTTDLPALEPPAVSMHAAKEISSANVQAVDDAEQIVLKLDVAQAEIAKQRKMLDQKSKEIQTINLQIYEKDQTIQQLNDELEGQRVKAKHEQELVQQNNVDLQRQLSEAQEAIRISKEATLKARKSAYKAAQQLRESLTNFSTS